MLECWTDTKKKLTGIKVKMCIWFKKSFICFSVKGYYKYNILNEIRLSMAE